MGITHSTQSQISINKMSEPATIPNSIKFLFGGSAGMLATCVVQPLDLVKNRMQVSKTAGGAKPTTLSIISGIIKNEGFSTLYNGLSAGLLRQATYTTTRLGIYTWLFETFSNDGKPPSFFMKAALGMTAGGIGAFVGTPAEVALIRMTSDGSLPVEQRRNYTSVFNALARIYKRELQLYGKEQLLQLLERWLSMLLSWPVTVKQNRQFSAPDTFRMEFSVIFWPQCSLGL